MKILTHKSSKIAFSELDTGVAFYEFYDEDRILYMKVIENELLQNAVSLATGCLWQFGKDDIVSIANVHIEDD